MGDFEEEFIDAAVDSGMEISEEEWAGEEKEVIEEFRKFAKESSEEYGDLYKRIREERRFISGEQWDKNDETNRGEGRAQLSINICGVYSASVVNPFAARPFKFKCIPRVNDPMVMQEAENLNSYLTAIQQDYDTNVSNTSGFKDEVDTGLGFTYATIEEVMGEQKIRYLYIEDATTVILDVNAKGVALEQSDRIAVVDMMNYDKAKREFGEDIVRNGKPEQAALSDFGSSWEVPKNCVAVVTYYRKDGHDVEYFRLCGDHIVDYGVFEGLDYLPVFAFTGDRIWVDDKKSFAGIVRKVKAQQKTINYAQSQLIERIAMSPKCFFVAGSRTIEGHEDDFNNIHYGNKTLLEYNDDIDEVGREIKPPQFIVPQCHTEDLQAVINSAVQQMSLATGISANGIVEQNLTDQKTATEVLLRTKSSQSNVSNYLDHAKETIRIAGYTLAQLCIAMYGINLPKGSFDIVVEEGCVSLTKMEEDREKLLAISQIVPDEFKPLISQQLVSKLDIEGGQQLSEMLYNMLPAELRGGQPSWQEFNAQQEQLAMLQQQLQEAQEQNKALNDQLTQQQLRTQTDLVLNDKNFAHDLVMKQIELAEKQGDFAAEQSAKAEDDARKSQHELDKMLLDASIKANERANAQEQQILTQTNNVPMEGMNNG